jgi:hypothetical protein
MTRNGGIRKSNERRGKRRFGMLKYGVFTDAHEKDGKRHKKQSLSAFAA